MKRLISIAAVLLLHIVLMAGEFEGYIKYKVSIDTDGDQEARAELEKFFGTVQYFYYKEGKYRIISNGVWGESIYYPEDNRRYNYDSESQSYTSQDCGQDNPLVFENYLTEDVQTVMDYQCQVRVLKTHNATIMVYHSGKIRIDPGWFSDHKLDFMDEISASTSSIPLKTVYFYGDVTVTLEAEDVKHGPIDESAFILRQNIPVDQVTAYEEMAKDDFDASFLPSSDDLPSSLDESDLETVIIDRLFKMRIPILMTGSNEDKNDRFTAFRDDNTDVEILIWTAPRKNERMEPFCTRKLQEIYRRVANPTLVQDRRTMTNGMVANVATLLADSPLDGGKDIYSLLIVDRKGYYLTAEIYAPERSIGDQQFILRHMLQSVERVWQEK